MTTLAVLADIHGNLPALEAVIRDMETFPIDRVVFAGDAVNWGPFPAQVLDVIRREGWAAIRGNHEYYLLDYGTPRGRSVHALARVTAAAPTADRGSRRRLSSG